MPGRSPRTLTAVTGAIGILAGQAAILWAPLWLVIAVSGAAAFAVASVLLRYLLDGPLRTFSERRASFQSLGAALPWRPNIQRIASLVDVLAGLVSELSELLPDDKRIAQEAHHLQLAAGAAHKAAGAPDQALLTDALRATRQAVEDAVQRFPRVISRPTTVAEADLHDAARAVQEATNRIRAESGDRDTTQRRPS